MKRRDDLLNFLKPLLPHGWKLKSVGDAYPYFRAIPLDPQRGMEICISVSETETQLRSGLYNISLEVGGRIYFKPEWGYTGVRVFNTREEVLTEIIRLDRNPFVEKN